MSFLRALPALLRPRGLGVAVRRGDSRKLAAPTSPRVTGQTSTTIGLAWDAHPNPMQNLDHFRAYYATTSPVDKLTAGYQVVGTAGATSGTLGTSPALTPSTPYFLALAAVDADGHISDLSAEVSAATLAPPVDVTAPSVPTGFLLGTPGVQDMPITWTPHPNADGDLAEIRAYFSTSSPVTSASPYQVIASGAGVAQASAGQLTGLAANTVYHVALAAADNAPSPGGPNVSALTAPQSASTQAAPSGVRAVFPSAALEMALGPQVIMGDRLMSGSATTAYDPWPYFTKAQYEVGHAIGGKISAFPPYGRGLLPAGTVSVDATGTVVDLAGGDFTQVLDANTYEFSVHNGTTGNNQFSGVLDTTGRGNFLTITPTQITLRAPLPAAVRNVTGRTWSTRDVQPTAFWTQESNYYDTVQAFYLAYVRSGEDAFRQYARKLARAWFNTPGTGLPWGGTMRDKIEQSRDPKEMSMQGLMIVAHDMDLHGESHNWWDWIWYGTGRYYNNWPGVNPLRDRSVPPYPGRVYSAREEGYAANMQLFGYLLFPDTYNDQNFAPQTSGPAKRAEYRTRMQGLADYFCGTQRGDGSWRWRAAGNPGGNIDPRLWGDFEQPFFIGILSEYQCGAHKVFAAENLPADAARIAALRASIEQAARHLYKVGLRKDRNSVGELIRAPWYVVANDNAVWMTHPGTVTLTPGQTGVVGAGTEFSTWLHGPQHDVHILQTPVPGTMSITSGNVRVTCSEDVRPYLAVGDYLTREPLATLGQQKPNRQRLGTVETIDPQAGLWFEVVAADAPQNTVANLKCRVMYEDVQIATAPSATAATLQAPWAGPPISGALLVHKYGNDKDVVGGGPIRAARQLADTMHHIWGYAYAITGNAEYLQMGDDVFGGSFGAGVGPQADAYFNLIRNNSDFGGRAAKEYAANCRMSGRYLGHRAGYV